MIPTFLLALAFSTWGQSAQMGLGDSAPDPVDSAAVGHAQVDSLYAVDALRSLEVAEELITVMPGDLALRWRAARASVALGMIAEDEDEQNAWYRSGEAHAARAVAADSLDLDALFWSAAAKGRLALRAGAREAAALGDEVWHLAHRILEIAPDHGGAHNVLGKLNHEVMALSGFERFLARLVLNDNEALRGSSWEGAERHHRRAIAADPQGILYHYDLARTLLRLGRREEAETELRIVLGLPVRYPPDPMLQDDARRRLERLESDR